MPGSNVPSERTPLVSSNLSRGTYAPAGPTDTRGPCPLVNCLANHGYINRTGRDIRASDLNTAMNVVGLSAALGAVFAFPIYNERLDRNVAKLDRRRGFLARLWYLLRNPWSIMSNFGLRRRKQVDGQGTKVLNLDQLATPGIIEHDVSLTRRDHTQKPGNIAPQSELVEDLLASSSDGKTITIADLAALRKRRIQRQLDENPDLQYGALAHQIACTEIALILDVFGNGSSVPCDYARAVFKEERLPIREGWTRRYWWTLGFYELVGTMNKVKSLVGLQV
ncbi:hypothetical protein LTR05_008315 [Lithohypha guttulata]|uniref:Heme haloperoxidase family profile domain-containing protein n=1 Tax=Lithohypha guttulata TaxID=1690604 RepID=A0AAN7YCY1_9EURO|nr:hypothetical protein LTR05_008315 [Lithohypha guttulata]